MQKKESHAVLCLGKRRAVSWQTRLRSDCSFWHYINSKYQVLKPGTILLLGVIQAAAYRHREGAWLVIPDLFIVCCLLLTAEQMVSAWGTDFKSKYVCNPGRVLPAVNMFVVHVVKTGPSYEKGVIPCKSWSKQVYHSARIICSTFSSNLYF